MIYITAFVFMILSNHQNDRFDSAAISLMIDPGHGGKQTGALGICGIEEKNLTLRLAQALKKKLLQTPKSFMTTPIYLTRQEDIELSLSQRAEKANQQHADLFVSIHANFSEDRRAHGIESYFLSIEKSDIRLNKVQKNRHGNGLNPLSSTIEDLLWSLSLNHVHHESQQLAIRLQDHLQRKLRWHNRGVFQASFAVLGHTQMPAVLLEVGFLSHPQECLHLKNKNYQQKIVDAIAEGLQEHVANRQPKNSKQAFSQ